MSTPATLRDLSAAIRERETVYILTVSDTLAPHVVQVSITHSGDELTADVGERTAYNARARPHVSVLFVGRDPDDYSLIVDAVASVVAGPAGPRAILSPTRAVLHRPAGAPDPATSQCGSDCIPLSLEAAAR